MTRGTSQSRLAHRLRLLVFYVSIALMVAYARPTTLGVAVGFLFVAAGESLRFWAAGHLVKTTELITSGPYRFTRNPLYLGRLLILIGLCVMARLPYHLNWGAMAVGCALFFGYYLPRKERIEPARLNAAHGEAYQRYHQAVPALLPTLHPFPEGASTGWSSDRLVCNREHWMLLGLALVTLYLLWRAAAIAA